MVIVVSDSRASREGYELLLDHYQDKPSLLTLQTKGDFLAISLTGNGENDVVKLNALAFDKEQLVAFQQSEPENRQFMLLVGTADEQQLVISATRDPFTPLVINAYHHEVE